VIKFIIRANSPPSATQPQVQKWSLKQKIWTVAEFHESRPAIAVQTRYCKVFEMETIRKISVYKSKNFQINLASFVEEKSVRDDQSLKLKWMKFECLWFGIRYIKIHKVCSLHNNVLYLKNKEDSTASTFSFISAFFFSFFVLSFGVQVYQLNTLSSN
jgi:hypothetical protein